MTSGSANARPRPDRWRRRKLLRSVAVFWTPVVVMVAVFFFQSVRDYFYVRQFDDWWSNRQSFQRMAGLKVLGAVRAPRAQLLERQMNPEQPDATTVRLDVDRSTWDAHAASVEHGFESFMDANILDRGDFHPVKIRFRGDTSVHWLTEKRSFTLKTRRSQLWRGYRRLAFSSKTVLEQLLTSRLAQEFDLLAPDTWLSPVYLNDRFYGLYRVLEQVDESMLRRRNRLPGNIYRGDAAERGEYFKGLERSLFLNPYIWDRTAKNDRPTAPPPDILESWLRDMNGTTVEDHLRFVSRVDRTQIANLLALMLVTGDLFHMSGIHNQFWYEDPVTAKLHPIPWDIELRWLRNPPHQVNRFLRAVFRDPLIFDEALAILYRKITQEDLLDRAVQIVQPNYERHRVFFEYDELRAGAVSRVGTPDLVLPAVENPDQPDRLRDNIALLKEWFADSRARWTWGVIDESTVVIDIESRGYAGMDLTAITLTSKDADGAGAAVFADRNRNGLFDQRDTPISTASETFDRQIRLVLNQPIPILSGINSDDPLIKPEPHVYRFFVRTEGFAASSVESAAPVLVNRMTGITVQPVQVEVGENVAVVASIHPWDLPQGDKKTLHFRGEVHLTKSVVVESQQTLIIEKGTTVHLDPDVSIISKGKVVAAGTAEEPILFTSVHPQRPWGTFALLQDAAAESSLTHCIFERGGGALWRRIEFKGMVCVHDVRGVRFDSCVFRDNLRCDDAINVVAADVVLSGCRFERANADAIDYDLSTGRIERCVISDSGNDGIDLMSCSPQIVDNRITGSADKGISIGEDAAPLVLGNDIRRCSRGIEVKDRSAPFLAFNQIEQNEIGLLEAVKNWRYGSGGRAKLVGCRLSGNQTDLELDQHSIVTLAQTEIGDPVITASRDEAVDAVRVLSVRGVLCGEMAPLRCGDRRELPPGEAIFSEDYREDFVSLTDGWVGWPDMRKRDGRLSIRTDGRDVVVTRPMYLTFDNSATAIFELATRSIKSVTITIVGDNTVSRTIECRNGLQTARFAALELDARHVSRIELAIKSAGRDSRLDLHGLRIFSLSPDRADRLVAGAPR